MSLPSPEEGTPTQGDGILSTHAGSLPTFCLSLAGTLPPVSTKTLFYKEYYPFNYLFSYTVGSIATHNPNKCINKMECIIRKWWTKLAANPLQSLINYIFRKTITINGGFIIFQNKQRFIHGLGFGKRKSGAIPTVMTIITAISTTSRCGQSRARCSSSWQSRHIFLKRQREVREIIVLSYLTGAGNYKRQLRNCPQSRCDGDLWQLCDPRFWSATRPYENLQT